MGAHRPESQGGGCNACHLDYGSEAARAIAIYAKIPRARNARRFRRRTPPLTLNPRNDHCFGCHSRSGRIALSYEGWNEMRETVGDNAAPDKLGTVPGYSRATRRLDDGRHVEKIVADVHHERGMEFIDCHTANELMGAGGGWRKKARRRQFAATTAAWCRWREIVDRSSARLLHKLRGWTLAPGSRMGPTRDGEPLVNVVVEPGKGARLLRKRTGEALPLKPPAAACTENKGHQRLSCTTSCHTAWAPRCSTCHTSFDPADEGFDHTPREVGEGHLERNRRLFEVGAAHAGRTRRGERARRNRHLRAGHGDDVRPQPEAGKPPELIHRRLYAKLSSHTTRREARSCVSCHGDPVALGLGKGKLPITWRPAARAAGTSPRKRSLPRTTGCPRTPGQGSWRRAPGWCPRARARVPSPRRSSGASADGRRLPHLPCGRLAGDDTRPGGLCGDLCSAQPPLCGPRQEAVTTADRRSRSFRIAFAAMLGALATLGPFSVDTYLPAFGGMQVALAATPLPMQQTLSAYLLTFGFMFLFHGALSDSFGRKPVIVVALAVFTVASVGAALASSVQALIGWRMLQGMSTGAGVVVGRAMIRDLYQEEDAQRLM